MPQLSTREASIPSWPATWNQDSSRLWWIRSPSSLRQKVGRSNSKTVPRGAATSVWTGLVAQAEEIGGQYCENCHVGKIVADITAMSEGVRGNALDPKNAEALWKKSEELVGESF
jgi:hypothetical protein